MRARVGQRRYHGSFASASTSMWREKKRYASGVSRMNRRSISDELRPWV